MNNKNTYWGYNPEHPKNHIIKEMSDLEIRCILNTYHKHKDYDCFFDRLTREYNDRERPLG